MVHFTTRKSFGTLTGLRRDLAKNVLGALASTVFLYGSGVSAAQASTTIPFNEALSFSYNPNATGLGGQTPCCDYVNIVVPGPTGVATNTYSKSGTWGSVDAFASADLATGQLKMRAGATVGDGSAAPSIQSNAIFGDGFHAATPAGQDFAWTSTSSARFTLNLSGTLTSSQPLDSNFNPDAFVILSILQKGTLDPDKPLINGPTAQQYFFWNIGNPSTTIYYTDQNGNSQVLTPTAQYSSIPASITANFTPGADFDWVLLMGASGQVSNPGDSFDFDLSHTLNLSFSGPDGSVMTSASNQFVNFGSTLPPVPEPGSLLMMLTGLAVVFGVRRRH